MHINMCALLKSRSHVYILHMVLIWWQLSTIIGKSLLQSSKFFITATLCTLISSDLLPNCMCMCLMTNVQHACTRSQFFNMYTYKYLHKYACHKWLIFFGMNFQPTWQAQRIIVLTFMYHSKIDKSSGVSFFKLIWCRYLNMQNIYLKLVICTSIIFPKVAECSFVWHTFIGMYVFFLIFMRMYRCTSQSLHVSVQE